MAAQPAQAGRRAYAATASSPNSAAKAPPRASSSAGVPLSTISPVLEHRDPVGQRERRQPLRGQQDGPAGERVAQAGDDPQLGLGVHGRQRVVEHEHRRVAEQRARERDALALAARRG